MAVGKTVFGLWWQEAILDYVTVSRKPDIKELAKWLDEQLATFDKIYAGDRPRYIDGYKKLKAAIRPWGAA